MLAERKEPGPRLDDDARSGELQLESLSGRHRQGRPELAEYDWRSAEARQKYEQIKDLLGRDAGPAFAGMKDALENATDEDRQAVNDMLDDLEQPAGEARQGEDTQQDFPGLLRPSTASSSWRTRRTSTSCWTLAHAMAAAQRFHNSLSEDQRAELDALAQAFGRRR